MTTFARTHPAKTRPASGVRPWMLGWLLAALLLAPWLGGIHAVLHQRTSEPGGTTTALAASGLPATVDAAAATAGVVGDRGLFRLFGGHTHDNDCRLFDQLSHADGLHLAAALPPVVLPPIAVLAWHAGECLRRWATLFDARGPPFLA